MALSPKLALRQSTSLVMTPQLQQAIKLLQLSNQELETFVDSEIEENPLLERESTDGGLQQDMENPAETSEAENTGAESGETGTGDTDPDAGENFTDVMEPSTPDSADLAASENLPDSSDNPLDTDLENVYTNDERSDLGDTPPAQFEDWGTGGSFEGELPDIDERLTEETSLRDHLAGQISIQITEPGARLIAATLIDSLDEAGYLRIGLDEVANQLDVPETDVESVLKRAQECDPPGVFARDLGECLALQLRDLDRLDPAMDILVKNLERLARREIDALKRMCGVDNEDFTEMVAEIRALNPKPGLAFGTDVVQTVIPDIIVRAAPDGGWRLELNADTLPRVLVNQTYYAEISKVTKSKSDRAYVNECLQSANWLIKALHERQKTILKVSTEIVRTQNDFLLKGVQYLKPLTLREVADVIGMHESTVSRVTTNKFMATPRGVFELKYFFTTAITSSTGGDAHSAESVRHRIKDLISKEAPKAILSDDKIVEILSSEGIVIARRTIAKYRESLHIPSSVQRRREKA